MNGRPEAEGEQGDSHLCCSRWTKPCEWAGLERVRDLDGQREQNRSLDRFPCDALLQRCIQKFHGHKGYVILVVNFVDGAESRVLSNSRTILYFPDDLVGERYERHVDVHAHLSPFSEPDAEPVWLEEAIGSVTFTNPRSRTLVERR